MRGLIGFPGLALAPVRERKGVAVLCIAAIALGVALGYAVQLINRAATGEFENALRVLSGSADLTVHGPRSGFDEELYERVANLPEVAAASPVVELEARTDLTAEPLRVLGIDIFRATLIQPELAAVEEGEPLDFLKPDRVFLSRSAAEALGVGPAEAVTLRSGLAEVRFVVAGLLSPSVRERLALVDIAAAQDGFGRVGSLSRLEIRLRPGVDAASAAAALQRELPPGLVLEPPAQRIERNANLTRAYRVNLNVLSLVAVFTGALLVFSSQALAVVRRRAQFALLRALGVTRTGIVLSVLGEAALLGALGGLLGVALGQGLAQAVLERFGADLGAGFFRGVRASAPVEPLAMLGFASIGVAAAVAGSLAAALEAARAAPARALRAGDEEAAFARLDRLWPGLALMAAGLLATRLPPIEGLPLFGYGAIALLLVGALLLMPAISRAVFAALPLRGPVALQVGIAQLRGAPGPAGVSLAAIVASVALMASMAIMVFSFRQSLDHWLVHVLPADVYLRLPASGASLIDAEEQAALAALQAVERVEFTRFDHLLVDPARPPVTLLARTLEPSTMEQRLMMVAPQRLPAPGEPPPAWVNEAFADLFGTTQGATFELPLAGRSLRFTVAGIWRDYARQTGAVVIERSHWEAAGGSAASGEVAIWLAPGADRQALGAQLMARFPAAELSAPQDLRELSLRIFDRTFAVTYALEAAAVLIALFALASSFAALAAARRREFGVLRHLGMTRTQLGALIAWEGALVSGVGLAAGLVLGWSVSLILVHVVNRQSFHWSMDVYMPWVSLLAFTAILLALASAAAWLGARSALRVDAVRAVSEAW